LLKLQNLAAKRGEILNFFPQSGVLSSWIVVVGLGKKNEFVANDLRLALGRFAKNEGKNSFGCVITAIRKTKCLFSEFNKSSINRRGDIF
jgi:hypothetical protein